MPGTLQSSIPRLRISTLNLHTTTETDRDLSTVRAEKDALSEKLAWIDAYVVYVENDGTNYYHNYDCENFKKSSFWVYNRKLAENKGYTACPICGG